MAPGASRSVRFRAAQLTRSPTGLARALLAGFGACLLLVLGALRLTRGRPGTVLAATALATGLGWAAEHSVFALAGADPMDFHAQTLGAGLAGLALLMGRAEESPPLPCVLLGGCAVLAGGFYAFLA